MMTIKIFSLLSTFILLFAIYKLNRIFRFHFGSQFSISDLAPTPPLKINLLYTITITILHFSNYIYIDKTLYVLLMIIPSFLVAIYIKFKWAISMNDFISGCHQLAMNMMKFFKIIKARNDRTSLITDIKIFDMQKLSRHGKLKII